MCFPCLSLVLLIFDGERLIWCSEELGIKSSQAGRSFALCLPGAQTFLIGSLEDSSPYAPPRPHPHPLLTTVFVTPEGRRRETRFSLSPQSLHGVSWDWFVPATLSARWFLLTCHTSFSCLCTWIVALALACRHQITLELPVSFCVSYFTIRT